MTNWLTKDIATAQTGQEDRSAILAHAPWALVSYSTPDVGPRAGVLTSDGAIRTLPWLQTTMLGLLQQWESAAERIESADPMEFSAVLDAALDMPIRFPPKLVFAGANYHSHVREMGGEVPPGTEPFFFLKPPSTTLIPDRAPIVVDESTSARIDWEAELGVVIGRPAKHVSRANALEHVAGYVVLNDITDRSRLKRLGPSLGPPFEWDWLSSKARDGSCPIGAPLVPASLVGDPDNLPVRLWVNDELMQDDNTGNMVADVPTLLEAITEVFTLEPGDILATGTPAGVGAGRERFLHPGDVVTVEIAGVGRLTTPVVGDVA